jgi:hypothetical protein
MKKGLLFLLLWGACLSTISALDSRDAAWVKSRVREWQPTPAEKRWESIGWITSLSDALRLAKTRRRPVFLFTLDGKMNLGRC